MIPEKIEIDPNAEWFEEQEHANDIIPEVGTSLDELRKKAKKAAEEFENSGRPMGGAPDD